MRLRAGRGMGGAGSRKDLGKLRLGVGKKHKTTGYTEAHWGNRNLIEFPYIQMRQE